MLGTTQPCRWEGVGLSILVMRKLRPERWNGLPRAPRLEKADPGWETRIRTPEPVLFPLPWILLSGVASQTLGPFCQNNNNNNNNNKPQVFPGNPQFLFCFLVKHFSPPPRPPLLSGVYDSFGNLGPAVASCLLIFREKIGL